MSFFKKRKILPIPEGFTADSVKIESSICNGEKTIGFYDNKSKKLVNAEFVKSEKDIRNFYEKYGIEYNQKGSSL